MQAVRRPSVARWHKRSVLCSIRCYRVLALESSCDDCCVALLERNPVSATPEIIDEAKATLPSAAAGGVIPTAAHEFHQQNMGRLVSNFCARHGVTASNPPHLICVTRGPGMVGSLSASLQLAKGLALAWDRPLIGVHHMLGHLLSAKLPMKTSDGPTNLEYPFLSLLCSGGHTMLVLSKSLTEHEIIINTSDIAAGDSLDKCARELGFSGDMLGPELERYVSEIDEDTRNRFAQIRTDNDENEFGFRLKAPMRASKHKKIPDTIEFGFSSFLSSIKLYLDNRKMDEKTREFVAFKLQDVLFDHIVDRVKVAFLKHYGETDFSDSKFCGVRDFVCSGGVAANKVLREKLASKLNSDKRLRFHFPDLALCTDNAAMIGNAGIEIFENLRLESSLDILPIRKWPISDLLKVDGWQNVNEEDYKKVIGVY